MRLKTEFLQRCINEHDASWGNRSTVALLARGELKDIEDGLEDVLREYTKYLCEHGYCDDDVWCENDAVLDFLKQKNMASEQFKGLSAYANQPYANKNARRKA